jgi:hypothetical protein
MPSKQAIFLSVLCHRKSNKTPISEIRIRRFIVCAESNPRVLLKLFSHCTVTGCTFAGSKINPIISVSFM